MWVFGLLRSRSPHVEATDINMTGDTDLSGEHALRHYIVHHQCVEMDQHVDHELSSRILYKARVVWEMIIKTLSSTDSGTVRQSRVLPESLDKPPRVGGRQHLLCLSGLVDDDQDMYRNRIPIY